MLSIDQQLEYYLYRSYLIAKMSAHTYFDLLVNVAKRHSNGLIVLCQYIDMENEEVLGIDPQLHIDQVSRQ